MNDGELTLTIPDALVERIAERAAEIVLARLGEVERDGGWPEWMSVSRAAKYIDTTDDAVRNMIARRQLPAHQEAPGCRIYLRRSEIDRALEQR